MNRLVGILLCISPEPLSPPLVFHYIYPWLYVVKRQRGKERERARHKREPGSHTHFLEWEHGICRYLKKKHRKRKVQLKRPAQQKSHAVQQKSYLEKLVKKVYITYILIYLNLPSLLMSVHSIQVCLTYCYLITEGKRLHDNIHWWPNKSPHSPKHFTKEI